MRFRKSSGSTLYLFVMFVLLTGCGEVLTSFATLKTLSLCQKNPTAKSWNDLGSGTLSDPYVICTPAQFVLIGKTPASWGKNFVLGSNLDFSAYDRSTADLSIQPIGTYDSVTPANSVGFTGNFDGGGYALQNMKLVSASGQSVAPFGYTLNAVIHDLKVTGIDVSGTTYVAGLVGANKSSLIKDVYVEGKASGTERVSGLVANNDGSGVGSDASITRAVTKMIITGSGASGGLGGLITVNTGQNGGRADITDCSALGSVTMTSSGDTIGGFIAYNIASAGGSAKISGSFSTGNVTLADRGSFSGTFVGTNTGDGVGTDTSITRSYTTGSITAPGNGFGGTIGGLVGAHNCNNGAFCSIVKSYVRGNVTIPDAQTGRQAIGLLIGGAGVGSAANMSITDSYAVGTITILSTASVRVGGLVGSHGNGAGTPITVERSYASVTITAAAPGVNHGAIFGLVNTPASLTVTDTYWNGDLYLTGSGTAVTGIATKTAAQLMMRATFPAWDFTSVWKINEGVSFPTL